MSISTVSTPSAAGLTRRGLISGGIAGAGAIALEACAPDRADVELPGGVFARRVAEVPTQADSPTWDRATVTSVEMDGQIIALPFRPAPAVSSMLVSALHDGSSVAFRLEWADADVHDLTVRVDEFRDACAVLLGAGQGDQALRTMGTAAQPVTLLHWKADWQRDVDQGVQGEAAVYPNRSIDVYPPLIAEIPRDLTPADYERAGATQWLPGLAVANPLSASTRPTCVEKLTARGFGSATHSPAQDATGRGDRTDGGWKVVITKPLGAADPEEVGLAPGSVATCAFAIWSGGDHDAGGRKSPSKIAYQLVLER